MSASTQKERKRLADVGALLDVKQTAIRLGTTPSHIRTLIDQRELDAIKLGKKVRVSEEALLRFLDGHPARSSTDRYGNWS